MSKQKQNYTKQAPLVVLAPTLHAHTNTNNTHKHTYNSIIYEEDALDSPIRNVSFGWSERSECVSVWMVKPQREKRLAVTNSVFVYNCV